MYSVTLWRVRVTIVAVETQQWLPFMLYVRCGQKYKILCCNGKVTMIYILYCWRPTLVAANSVKYTKAFVKSALYFCPILTKFGFSRQILVKDSAIKFRSNLSNGSRADICEKRTDWRPDRQTWRHKQALFANLWTRLKTRHTRDCPVSCCFWDN